MKFKAITVYLLMLAASVFLSDFVKAQNSPIGASSLTPPEAPAATSNTAAATQGESGSSAWGLNFFSLGGVYEEQFKRAEPSMNFFENYLGLSYRPNRDLRFGVRYSFTYKTDGLDEQGRRVIDANQTESSDMSLIMTMRNLFEDRIPSAVEIKSQPRLYLPTSDKSKAQGLIASLRIENEMKYYFNRKQVLRAWFQPRYYFQRNTAFPNATNGSPRTTEMAQSKHGLEFSQGVSNWFAIKPGFEIEDSWSNSSPANNLREFRESAIDYRLGLEFTISREINTTLGFSYNQDFINTGDFERQVTLMTNVSLF